MGKYLSGAASAAGPIMPRGCGNLPGYVNDTIGEGCWAVHGAKIVIGDKAMSIHAGFECVNFNFRVDGTKAPSPNRINLRV